MAIFRTVYMSFWTDPKVDDDFTPEDKYFYLYLLTNPHTKLSGCYEVSVKAMCRETGYNEDTVSRLLKRMENVHHVIEYDPNTKEVFIPNWHRYNWANSPKTIKGAIEVASAIKSPEFRKKFNSILIGYGYPIDTLSIPYAYPMHTSVTVTDTDTVTDIDELFNKFYTEYPRKAYIEKAKETWKALHIDQATFNAIMEGLGNWKASDEWEDKRYIPYPAKWLEGRRWEDAPEIPKYNPHPRLGKLQRMYEEEMNKRGQG